MNACVFCEIVAGRAPATFVYTWPDALAFVPLNPVTEGHTLVIPRVHVANFATDPEVSAATMRRAAEAASAIRPDGPMNLITSWGREAGQEVGHLAIELIPREELDGKPVSVTLDGGGCPVCFQPRVRRHGRELATCGDIACSYEIRARKKRGSEYCGGRPPASEDITYNAAHARARKQLKGRPCTEADETCSGRLEVALRPGLPDGVLRVEPSTGSRYHSGLDSSVGYRVLCRSHHAREGGLMAALSRHPHLADAFRLEQFRGGHGNECPTECPGCAALQRYDEVLRRVLHLVPRAENDGLALPWYSGRGGRPTA